MQATASNPSDSDLLLAIARGEEKALSAIYDRYRLILFSLILRILHDRAEAEDTLQEVFLQVWRRAGDFDERRGRPFTWLVTIARSRALDRLRSTTSRARIAQEASESAFTEASDENDAAARSEAGALVRRALAELPGDQRQALFLAYFHGLTQSEIADKLATPLGTIKTRMRSGLTRLRQSLQESIGRTT